MSKSEGSFESDGTGSASVCDAGANAAPSGSGVSPGVNRNVVFSRRESSPPNGDGVIEEPLPGGDGPGKSRVMPLGDIETFFRVFHLNVCDFDAHAHLLDTLLRLQDYPDFVAITETHLREGLKEINLTNYVLVSRRDRIDSRPAEEKGWGGVALFARSDVYQSIVFTEASNVNELTWHTLHSDIGPILLGVWYRPPHRGETASVRQFEVELETHSDFVGKIIVGDMNVHNEHWLTFSNGMSPEGRELEQICASHGLKQRVKHPTRGEHLLDLVLTDVIGQVKCEVVPGVLDKDHSATIATFNITIPSAEPSTRECFDIKKAHWNKLQKSFEEENWAAFFQGLDADRAAIALTNRILSQAKRHIPVKIVRDRPYKHPWIDQKCCELLRAKHEAIGTPAFTDARDACTAGFLEDHSE